MNENAASWQPESLSQYEDNSAVIYVTDSDLRLVFCNSAWDRFAQANGGSHLVRPSQIGRSVMDVTPVPLRRFYSTLFGKVLTTGDSVDRVYECSSDEVFRRFHMHLSRKNAPGRCFVIAIHSLILETPHPDPGFACDSVELREDNGYITMCSHCRRTRLPKNPDVWLWIPDLVRRMPLEISHGICPVCFDIHYGE